MDSKTLIDKFRKFFLDKSYLEFEPESLISKTDRSTAFTGSTISTFKQYILENGYITNSYFCLQKCLRTQNANKLLSSENINYSSYFNSFGLIDRYNRLDDTFLNLKNFFLKIGFLNDSIFINVSSKDQDLLKVAQRYFSKEHLLLDTKSPQYYRHKYGVDSLKGRNCNVAVKNGKEIRDIGNIIVLEYNGNIIGIEAAFGIETILSRLFNTLNPLDFFGITKELNRLNCSNHYKLADGLIASLAIINCNIRPNSKDNRGRALKKYIRGVRQLLDNQKNISFQDIEKICSFFEYNEFDNTSKLNADFIKYLNYENCNNF